MRTWILRYSSFLNVELELYLVQNDPQDWYSEPNNKNISKKIIIKNELNQFYLTHEVERSTNELIASQ